MNPKEGAGHESMRLIMMGTGPYAVPTFRSLLDSDHVVAALFTRPDVVRPGRRKPAPNPMRALAVDRDIDVLAPDSVNTVEAQATLRDLAADLFIVCDYGQILAPETLALAPQGGLNLHASLLPKYRGAAPIVWALYHGDTETGNTVIHMTPTIDAGPCVAQQRVAIDPGDTAETLEMRLSEMGSALVLQAIADVASGAVEELTQDKSQVTQAPKLKKSDGQVDWSRTAHQIANQVRAMHPWPKTFTHWMRPDGPPIRLILGKVCVSRELGEIGRSLEPGVVVEASLDRLLLGTGDGVLRIEQLQPSGKRLVTSDEFLRGYPIKPGDRMGNLA